VSNDLLDKTLQEKANVRRMHFQLGLSADLNGKHFVGVVALSLDKNLFLKVYS